MKLIYLSAANMNDRMFVREFVNNYKIKGQVLLLHDVIGGTVSLTQSATKRISALLSETMVYNNIFSAHQRNFFYESDVAMEVDHKKISDLLSLIPLLILSPVVRHNGSIVLADPLEMVHAARNAFEIEETIVFTKNPLSPLASKKERISEQEDVDRLVRIYEEESQALQIAHSLRPVTLASPVNYAK